MDILRPFESGLRFMIQLYVLAIFVIGFFAVFQGLNFFESEMGKNILIALGLGFCLLALNTLILIGLRKMFYKLAASQEKSEESA